MRAGSRWPGLTLLLALLALAPAVRADGVDAQAILAAHNRWRAEVGVGPLQHAPDLAASAQAWADELKQGNRCRMRHSEPRGRYGENLFWASAVVWSDGRRELSAVPPAQPVDSWGGEKRDYDPAKNSCAPGKVCGHYTQMVWKHSTQVGCARAVCEDSREQVWVCHYRPAGNVVGQRPY